MITAATAHYQPNTTRTAVTTGTTDSHPADDLISLGEVTPLSRPDNVLPFKPRGNWR